MINNTPEIKADLPKGRMKKPKGWGHWTAFLNSAEYEKMVPEDREITDEELAKHNKPGDIWIGLMHENKICVFDVTLFAEYHPGGYDILLNVAGKDATQEFRIAHAYVSTNMILKFKKGYLVRSMFKSPNTLSPGMSIIPPVRRPPPQYKPRWDWNEKDKLIVLKFDLTRPILQKSNSITIQYQENIMKLRIFLETEYYHFEIKLNECLKLDMDSICVSENCRAISMELKNTSGFMASHLGAITMDKVKNILSALDDECYFKCSLSSMRDINHDCRELVFDWPDNCKIGIPLGHHVNLRITNEKNKQIIQKPYTPICTMSTNTDDIMMLNKKSFSLMIKRYPEGQMSPLIHSIDVGDTIEVSLPFGQFKSPKWLLDSCGPSVQLGPNTDRKDCSINCAVLIAAGTGITPMMRIIVSILTTTTYRIRLLYFNRQQKDMIYYDEFEAISKYYGDRFSVDHTLSQPDKASWKGYTGRITEDLMTKILDGPNGAQKDTFDYKMSGMFMFCGPTGFNKTCVGIMNSMKISSDKYWEFKG